MPSGSRKPMITQPVWPVTSPSCGSPSPSSDQAFSAAGLDCDVAFEVTNADFLARLAGQGFGVAMLPSAYAPQLTGMVTIEVADAPARVEYVIWNHSGHTPAAATSLAILDISAMLGTE